MEVEAYAEQYDITVEEAAARLLSVGLGEVVRRNTGRQRRRDGGNYGG